MQPRDGVCAGTQLEAQRCVAVVVSPASRPSLSCAHPQEALFTFLASALDTGFDDVVAMLACLKAQGAARADCNRALSQMLWTAITHPSAPLLRPAVAASVSEADDVGAEITQSAGELWVYRCV